MDDQTCTVDQLKDQIRCFVQERDWEQFHTPKDLAIGLAIEAAEVLEHFRFQSETEIAAKLAEEASLKDISKRKPYFDS